MKKQLQHLKNKLKEQEEKYENLRKEQEEKCENLQSQVAGMMIMTQCIDLCLSSCECRSFFAMDQCLNSWYLMLSWLLH